MAANRDPGPVGDGTAASRLGLFLFWIYVALYGGFMALVLVRPDLLSRRPFGGVNLAILYGMGLIVAAFVLAVIYMLLRAGHREEPRA
ncbi:MAG: DUF485 domain-containing protein [Planctomycetaceae bacterium]